MNYDSDLIYKIAISQRKGVGDITSKKLFSYCGSAESVFKESKSFLEKIPNFNNNIINSITSSEILKRAEK